MKRRVTSLGFAMSLAVLLGLVSPAVGQINFDNAVNFAAGTRPDGAAFADFDGDGDRDLAVSSEVPDKVTFFMNDGTGQFAAGLTLLTGAGTAPGALSGADLDGDGDMDLAVVLKNSNSVRIYHNNGNGSAFTAGALVAVGLEPVRMIAHNLRATRASVADLVVTNRTGNSVSVLLNNGAGGFSSTSYPVGADPRGAAANDFNGDGAADLAVTNHDDRSISILLNNGTGTFSAGATLSVGTQVRPEGITSADLDNDGDFDIAAATGDPGFATVFLNSGGVFAGPFHYSVGGAANPDSIVAADLDCDGDVDLATSNQDLNNVSLLPNAGNGTFGAAVIKAVGTRPGTIIAADINGNLSPDLAVVNRDSNDVSILRNLGACISPGDMNCDGSVNGFDVDGLVLALTNPTGYAQQFPQCDIRNGDINSDGSVNGFDVDGFVGLLGG